jgi:pre-mRNA-splicing factor SYF1
MAALERQARAPQGFVASSTGPEGGNIRQVDVKDSVAPNPEVIDIEDLDED